MDDDHRRPAGVDDATVAATGKLGEAVEWVERARGRLYDFHQMMGRADFLMEDAADALAEAGHGTLSDHLRREIIGRNVLDGRWTYQVVEEFEDCYYLPVRDADRRVRDTLLGGKPHVLEAELKERRRSHGVPRHESEPAARYDS